MSKLQIDTKKASSDNDLKSLIDHLRKQIENGARKSIQDLSEENSEDRLFYLGAYYVTTTKKALCKTIGVPVEAACRYKRTFEKEGKLKQSDADVICPVTKHPARLISTNPNEFKKLENSDQLKMFAS